MKIIRIILITILFLAIQACDKDAGPFIKEKDTSQDTLSYIEDIQPVFDASCIECHNESHDKLDLRSALSYNELLTLGFSAPYVNTTDPEMSNIYLHLIGTLSIMPTYGTLPDTDKALVLKWIQNGALNN